MTKETFYVQLITRHPKQKDEVVTQDCPEIPVKAPGKFEAQAAYTKFCGILSTEKAFSVLGSNEIPPERKAAADKLATERRWNCQG